MRLGAELIRKTVLTGFEANRRASQTSLRLVNGEIRRQKFFRKTYESQNSKPKILLSSKV